MHWLIGINTKEDLRYSSNHMFYNGLQRMYMFVHSPINHTVLHITTYLNKSEIKNIPGPLNPGHNSGKISRS